MAMTDTVQRVFVEPGGRVVSSFQLSGTDAEVDQDDGNLFVRSLY